MIYQEVDLASLHLQTSEVQDARWATKEEVLALAKAGNFIPYFFLSNLFDLKDDPLLKT